MLPNSNLKNIMTKTQTTDYFILCKQSRIESNTSFYGCFYLGPFDDSLSQTLSNDLRRTLLSELTGLAITSIEIEGVLHKFSSLPGMKESVLDLICNLQSIVLKTEKPRSSSIPRWGSKDKASSKDAEPVSKGANGTSATFALNKNNTKIISFQIKKEVNKISKKIILSRGQKGRYYFVNKINKGDEGLGKNKKKTKKTYTGFLNVSGPRVIRSIDLKLPAGLECVDPNQYIATLAEDGLLNMKFTINEGKNFIKQKPHNLDGSVLKKRNILLQNFKKKSFNYITNKISNIIPLDAVFMPVTKINCIIEENNLYTDFNSDSIHFLDQTKSAQSLFDNKGKNMNYNNKFQSFLNKVNFNSIYETSLVLQKNSDSLSSSFNLTSGVSSLSPQRLQLPFVSIDQKDEVPSVLLNYYFKLRGKQRKFALSKLWLDNDENKREGSIRLAKYLQDQKKFKVIPWQANSLFFNLNYPENNIKTFLGSKPSFKKSFLLSQTQRAKTFFFKSNKIKASASILNLPFSIKSSYNISSKSSSNHIFDQRDVNGFSPSQKNKTEGLFLAFGPGPKGLRREPDVLFKQNIFFQNKIKTLKTFLKNKSYKAFKINPLNGLNKNNQYLEYNKILQLKPLRKKNHLIVEIWTNGSLHPRQALYQSFMFLSNNFLKLQTVKSFGSMFKSQLAYGNLKYSISNNYHLLKNKKQRFSSPFSKGETRNKGKRYALLFKPSSFSSALAPQLRNITSNHYGFHGWYPLKTMMPYLQMLVAKNEGRMQMHNQRAFYLKTALKAPIGILKISLRAYTALKKAGIFTLNDLILYSKKDLLKINNIGTKSLSEIEINLSDLGLTLK